MTDLRELLHRTVDHVADHRASLGEARVAPSATFDELVSVLGGRLDEHGRAPAAVVEELVRSVAPGIVASAGPRYFGFVIGGSVDAALAADVLACGWDQNGFNNAMSPAAAAAEYVAGTWLRDLLGLPGGSSVGFVTGAQAANTVGLAAARHHLLRERGWDVEADGLWAAPAIRVLGSVERHVTIDRSLRLLGMGTSCIEGVDTGPNGAIDVDALAAAIGDGGPGPTIVCLQAGNVNTGACDDFASACAVAHDAGAWVHVDGAFGLWAAASPARRHLVDGIELADSWCTDGHKWLNAPYDVAYAFCAHPDSHRAAMAVTAAAYLTGQGEAAVHHGGDWVPEASRRARGFATWAALRQLGRGGVASLVDRCCELAERFAARLAAGGCEIRNDVMLNQVLVEVAPDEATTDRVVEAVQADGTCWLGATTWRGERLLRISVSNHATTETDIDRSAEAVLRARASLRT